MKKCPNCGELVGDNVDICFNCRFDFKKGYEELRKNIEAINDFYEYDVVCVLDDTTGCVDINLLKSELEKHGKEGWRLVNTFSNEIGKITQSIGAGGVASGTNATIDQTILLFERCIKRYK